MKRHFAAALLVAAACPAITQAAPVNAGQAAALDRISADSLRGHLSFIASDLLEGRGTPSRGQDLAAEYIAAQYRRAGLEPMGDDEYFQTANWTFNEPNLAGFALTLRAGQQQLVLPLKQVSFKPGPGVDAKGAAIIKANWNDLAPLEAMGAAVAGKAVLIELPTKAAKSMAEYEQMTAEREAVLGRIAKLKPLVLLALDRRRPNGDAGGKGTVTDPAKTSPSSSMPVLGLHGEPAIALLGALPTGATGAALDVHLEAGSIKPIKLRNVAALLRGSDPVLKQSYVLLSAHYDHLGIHPDLDGDNIFNGANDNGSGTVSLIEVASALAGMKERPKRSILFLNVFGEELGMLGSAYYGRHPLVPLAQTVANLNLEQVGRTDGADGPNLAKAALTGYDFSSLPATMAKAGVFTGVKIYKDQALNEKYFAQSDNVALAERGVPGHTLSVLYEFPDYHKVGDHWQKIDYANLAKVSRMVAMGALMLADAPDTPQWNEAHPLTAPYVKARKAVEK